jgi:glycine dehydrogenase subunit 1
VRDQGIQAKVIEFGSGIIIQSSILFSKGYIMSSEKSKVHPYIPNSVPSVQAKMLAEIGVTDIDELYSDIPDRLRFKGDMNLPEPLNSEYALKNHVERILSKNKTSREYISFLGGGCWPHYVPAICDEINHRSEFLTAYAGEPYEDHGRCADI